MILWWEGLVGDYVYLFVCFFESLGECGGKSKWDYVSKQIHVDAFKLVFRKYNYHRTKLNRPIWFRSINIRLVIEWLAQINARSIRNDNSLQK